jgi:two-component system invasion response regulator UvrY
MIRVFIVDDHAVVRRGVRQILEQAGGYAVVGEAATAAEALAGIRGTRCDVVLLDISLPDRNGLEILEQLRLEQPKLPVIVLTMITDEEYVARFLRLGASGYVTKEAAPEELILAVQRTMAGGRYIGSNVAEKVAFYLASDGQKDPQELLSGRELQVLRFLAEGKTATEIGFDLGISVKTVSSYRARILEKTRLKNNADLVRYAVDRGLIR